MQAEPQSTALRHTTLPGLILRLDRSPTTEGRPKRTFSWQEVRHSMPATTPACPRMILISTTMAIRLSQYLSISVVRRFYAWSTEQSTSGLSKVPVQRQFNYLWILPAPLLIRQQPWIHYSFLEIRFRPLTAGI